jgi:hypothetical protein
MFLSQSLSVLSHPLSFTRGRGERSKRSGRGEQTFYVLLYDTQVPHSRGMKSNQGS